MNTIPKLRETYFQKSTYFLHPLVVDRNPRFLPISTYLSGLKYTTADRRLIATYVIQRQDNAWNQYISHLIKHPYYEKMVRSQDEHHVMLVYNLGPITEDYDLFIEGKYSKMSTDSKRRIMDYYGVLSPEWAYIESFLNPESYFHCYARLLGETYADIAALGELCTAPDLAREHRTLVPVKKN